MNNFMDVMNLPLPEAVPAAMLVVFSFVFGSCLGSFLNVCIWRIPLGESVVVVPSHCPKCNHKIRWFDNVPVIGFLALGGKCRDCKAPISPRYIIMELLVGMLFCALALLAWLQGARVAELIRITIMLSIAVPCAFIDVEHRKLPDKLTITGMILSVLFVWVLLPGRITAHNQALLWSLTGCGAGLVGLWAFARISSLFFRRRTLGAGDIKYAGFAGALYGVAGLVVTLFLASVTALLWVGAAALVGKKQFQDQSIAFGPFLGIGVLVVEILSLFFRS